MPTPPPPVHRSIEVETTPDDVWELLVDDDERAGWFGGETTLDVVPGGVGTFTESDGMRRTAIVETVDPGRRLSWTWWDDDGDADGDRSRVEIDLAPTPAGTRIDVVETPLVPSARACALTKTTGPMLELEHRILCRVHQPSVTCAR